METIKLKTIKFDLAINGRKVKNVEELRENITSELLSLGRRGTLTKWLVSRGLENDALAVEQAIKNDDDVDCFVDLCRVLAVEVLREDADLMISPPPAPGKTLAQDFSSDRKRLLATLSILIESVGTSLNNELARTLVTEMLTEKARLLNQKCGYIPHHIYLEGRYSIEVEIDQFVGKNDLLIKNGGRWPSDLHASCAGKVVLLSSGCVILEIDREDTCDNLIGVEGRQDVLVRSVAYLNSRK